MEDQKSAKRISIIALIISIIALLFNLLLWHWCHTGKFCHEGEEPAATEQVQPVAEEPEAPAAQPAAEADEPAPAAPVAHDGQVKKKAAEAPFIDLGLPSGTKWRTVNEEGLITHEEALATYGKQLPTQKQYIELQEKCKWQELKNGGYKVTGPNGNSITFPFTGFINCTGEFRGGDNIGDYWTATITTGDEAFRVAMNSNGVKIAAHTRCYQRAIRLVTK